MIIMLHNATLLVVDDDANNREAVAQVLLEYAPTLRLLSAINGKQALQILEKRPIDLILLDWEMPEMNGIETLQAIKKHDLLKEIPILMYTGIMTQSQHLKESLDMGAVDFLRKPADPIELLARVRSVLRQRQQQKQLLQAERDKSETLQKELQSYLLALAQKNEVLEDIKNRCEDSLKKGSPKENPKVSEISQHIEQLLQKGDYWTSFLDKFNQIDKDFIRRITQRFPDLSVSEMRYCALLRCGMDNKSIAHLLNISIESAMTTRYRIRKKMELESDDSLDRIVFGV